MTVEITNYTFDASAKTVTFTDYVTIDLANVISVRNITTNEKLYYTGLPGYTGSAATNVLTFIADDSLSNDTDQLLIFYEDPLITPGGGILIPQPLDANVVGPVGQQVMADSLPVTIASDQSAIPISGTVTVDTSLLATSAKQDTLLAELQLKADLTETQPVSLASLPLPTGASTEATLSTLNGKIPSGLTVTASRLQVELPAGGTGLTDTELRATPVDVNVVSMSGGGLTDAELRATPVPMSATNLDIRDLLFGTDKVDVSGSTGVGVTGTFWQATQPVSIAATVAVSGPLTDTQLRATAVPISGTIAFSNTTIDVTNTGTFATQAAQSGIWNIGSITTLPSIPAGTNNIGDVDVLSLPAIPAGTNNIGDVDVLTLPAVTIAAAQTLATVTTVNTITNTVPTKEVRSSTPSQSSPNVTNSSTVILASNANRLGATIYNEGSAICYLKLGATASLTSYTLQIATGGYYEVPFAYTGAIDGITSASTAQLRVTEIT